MTRRRCSALRFLPHAAALFSLQVLLAAVTEAFHPLRASHSRHHHHHHAVVVVVIIIITIITRFLLNLMSRPSVTNRILSETYPCRRRHLLITFITSPPSSLSLFRSTLALLLVRGSGVRNTGASQPGRRLSACRVLRSFSAWCPTALVASALSQNARSATSASLEQKQCPDCKLRGEALWRASREIHLHIQEG